MKIKDLHNSLSRLQEAIDNAKLTQSANGKIKLDLDGINDKIGQTLDFVNDFKAGKIRERHDGSDAGRHVVKIKGKGMNVVVERQKTSK